jgi:hypothetical protein
VKRALASLVTLLAAGCIGTQDWSKEPIPVTVSAANYSQSSPEEIYLKVHADTDVHPAAPAVAVPDRPAFYGFVPGEIYDSDVPLEGVYRELAIGLAHKGYFNVVYQAEAGRLPKRIDYLIVVHCGVRNWAVPTVRADKVTWGNAGVVSNERNWRSLFWYGEKSAEDARAGQDPMDAINTATFLQSLGRNGLAEQLYSVDNMATKGGTREYCLVVLEAFRFDDVSKLREKAPCIWATFVAVPLRTGQEFSNMLRTMVRTATPYFGTTTDGIQEYDLPAGKVIMGEPVVVPGPQATH